MSNQTIYMFPRLVSDEVKKVKSLNSKVTHFRDGKKPKLPILKWCLFCGNVFVYRFLILLIQYLYLNSKSKYGILQRAQRANDQFEHV